MNKRSAHTPGPWHARPSSEPMESVEWEINTDYKGGLCIALAYGGAGPDGHEENAQDNARLIAAAPQLAEALRDIMNDAEGINNGVSNNRWQAALVALQAAGVECDARP